MYSTCLFCNSALGRNQSIEHFPVGRRLAFDAAKGRLWVVCASCKRWNLSPLETRWEAIEEAERAYRDTRTRVATEQIGLAKLKEGLELVRVGRPLLPEFAAWRYGDVFRRRLRAEYAWLGLSLSMAAASAVASFSSRGNPSWSLIGSAISMSNSLIMIGRNRGKLIAPHLAVTANDGSRVRLSRQDAMTSDVVRHAFGGWSLHLNHRIISPTGRVLRALGMRSRVQFGRGLVSIEGQAAVRAMATLLPAINHGGGDRRTIGEAVTLASSSQRPLDDYLQSVDSRGRPRVPGRMTLVMLPPAVRLALEMSLHEADERRFLEGELHDLEQRWREADEIAAIADNMFTTDTTTARLDELKSRE